jgi:tetratricopeptide (TPR) repeat protein
MRCNYTSSKILTFAVIQFLFTAVAAGQTNSPMQGNIELRMNDVKINPFCDELHRLVVTVIGEDNTHLDRQAIVKLHDKKRDITAWESTSNESEVTFCNIDFGDYDLEVSAVGYLTAKKDWHLAGAVQEREFKMALQRDPMAVDLEGNGDDAPTSVRKEMKRIVSALKSGNLKDAQKRLEKLSKAAASSGEGNFLYGYLYVQRKDFDKAEPYLERAASLNRRSVQPMILLGRVQLQRKEYEAARKTLEGAVQADSNSWMAHNLLGDAYLKNKEYEKAREQAQIAMDQGKRSASVAQLVLGQALASLGRDEEGIKALKTFVETNPENLVTPQVKTLIGELEKRDAGLTASADSLNGDLTLAASAPSLPESAWGPPGVDDVKPAVVASVTCPSQQVIEGAGDRVKQLADNIMKFAAVEDMLHEQLDKFGRPISKTTRKFNYVASISDNPPGFLQTDEYRDLRYGLTDLPDHIVTTGFVTLALIFHPSMRDSFDMACEGLGEWHGQTAWLVHFQQRDDKPNRFADYVVGTQRYPVKLKGRAWITADNLQIVRIESDLAKPLPQLSVEHQIANYGPVEFKQQNVQLWLPQAVDIYLELNRHYYYRRHSFDHFMLFSVNSVDKTKMFKSPQESPVIKDALPEASVPTPN